MGATGTYKSCAHAATFSSDRIENLPRHPSSSDLPATLTPRTLCDLKTAAAPFPTTPTFSSSVKTRRHGFQAVRRRGHREHRPHRGLRPYRRRCPRRPCCPPPRGAPRLRCRRPRPPRCRCVTESRPVLACFSPGHPRAFSFFPSLSPIQLFLWLSSFSRYVCGALLHAKSAHILFENLLFSFVKPTVRVCVGHCCREHRALAHLFSSLLFAFLLDLPSAYSTIPRRQGAGRLPEDLERRLVRAGTHTRAQVLTPSPRFFRPVQLKGARLASQARHARTRTHSSMMRLLLLLLSFDLCS